MSEVPKREDEFIEKDQSPIETEISKIEPSQIGVKIEFSNGFYTHVGRVEQNQDGTVDIEGKKYKVGDPVKLTLYKKEEKSVFGFE